jgi:eukaryotic-like serine/threonine-protein kinase
MKTLSDTAMERLREAADVPDLSGTRYRMLGKLGEGGMAGVYRVQDTVLNREVALKVINAGDVAGDLAMRLLQEARVIAQLEHPGIVPVHDAGTLPDARVFYTMKFVQGRSLDQEHFDLAGLPERLRLFHKICDTVSFAHSRGVLHRDLKPQNIMIGAFGEVLVMDWGLSKLLGGASAEISAPEGDHAAVVHARPVTAHGSVLGTPGYMAPEQARGDVTALDHRADIYSLGAVLKFLLTNLRARPRAVSAIVGKAMKVEPLHRYGSVEELSRDVAHYLDGLPVSAYPEGPLRRLWRCAGKNRVWILLVLAYLLMRAALIFWRTR